MSFYNTDYYSSNYYASNYYRPKTGVTTGGAVVVDEGWKKKEYPTDFMAFIFKRGIIKEEEKEVLEVTQSVPEIKAELDEIQEEYFEFIDLIEQIPDYEEGIKAEQEEKYLKEVRADIDRITGKLEKEGITVEFIVALLASDLDEIEVSLVLAQCM